jgi:endonuclease III
MAEAAIAPEIVTDVEKRLRIYGTPSHHNKQNPLDELVFIILSAQTEEYTYLQTYEQLSCAYPAWSGLSTADEECIAEIIRPGGLYIKKSRQLKAIFRQLLKDFGTETLDELYNLNDQEAYGYLTSLPGVSRKTALCIMMYSLARQVFPVDTHTWRIARRLGWTTNVPKPTNRQTTALEELIPSHLRYSLHVNMVAHGRTTCLTYDQRCGTCPLASFCPSNGRPDHVWNDWRKPKGVWANNSPR